MHSVTQLWLIWKSSINTKSLDTKPYPAGLSPRIICQASPFLPKMSQNCYTHQGVDCSSFPWAFMGNLGKGKKSYPTAKNLLISPIRKILLNRFKSFVVKSFISSPSNSNFQVIILYNLHLQLQPFLLYHILNFRLYVHTCHANLTNQCLLNVAFSMTKALNDWSSPKQNFHSLHLSITSLPPMLLQKPCFYYCLFFSFSHCLFISNFIKFQLAPLQLDFCGLVG